MKNGLDRGRSTSPQPHPVLVLVRRLLLLAFSIGTHTHALTPADAPPLPPPAGMTVVNVNTAQALADACWNLTSNMAIVIAPGDYNLAAVAFPNGVDGRLTVGRFGAAPISNIQIRGATSNPADVRLHGAGMLNPVVPFGLQIFTATDVTIADLSVDSVYYHAVMVSGNQGAQRIRLYNLRLYDAGQQIIKGTAGGDDVSVESSELYYTAGAVQHPEGSPPNSCYTNAIDGVNTDRWVVRDNWIHDIRCQNNALAGPSVLLWQGSQDTVVERNTITNSSRGISLGLVSASDHGGGLVRNNFISWDLGASYAVDVPIYVASSNARVLHNTALTAGAYPNAIEVRYTGANNQVRNNLLDAAIALRNGAQAAQSGNLNNAQNAWFANPDIGDLHLTELAAAAFGAGTPLPEVIDDFDAQSRPSAAAVDLGADQWQPSDELHADGFEGSSAAQGTSN